MLGTPSLTPENYRKGFLIDGELMAGVSEDPETPGRFAAFVMQHITGECVGYEIFTELNMALTRVNSIPRSWQFESTSGCGGGNCGTGEGGCGNGRCGQGGNGGGCGC